MNIDKYMRSAKKEADRSKSEWKMGAVIVKGGKIVGRGHNRFSGKANKVELQLGVVLYSLHAEMSAIMNSSESLVGASIFVFGYKEKNGNRIYSRPCKHCMKMI